MKYEDKRMKKFQIKKIFVINSTEIQSIFSNHLQAFDTESIFVALLKLRITTSEFMITFLE